MSEFINTVDSIEDKVLTNSIIDRSITEIRDNYATFIGSSAFHGCSALTTVDFPAVINIKDEAFYSCSELTIADFQVATNIGDYAFYICYKLTSLILRSETMATLNGSSAFASTPIASGTGYIYVPSSLIDSYKTASNWSTYAAQFRALEDYTVDGTTTGALDESKI